MDDKTEVKFSIGKCKVMHCKEKQSEYYIGNEGFQYTNYQSGKGNWGHWGQYYEIITPPVSAQ